MEDIVVRGISVDKSHVRMTLSGVPDKPGVAARLFGELAGADINVEMIIQNSSVYGLADISFTVSNEDLPKTNKVIQAAAKKIGIKNVQVDENIAKISIVGVGMRSHPGVAFTMFKALADNRINILMISTSEIKISVVIQKRLADTALKALHKAFELSKTRKSSRKSKESRLQRAGHRGRM